MAFGDRVLQRGAEGEEVVELQIRLAGFHGGVPDGKFGPGTELQVTQFQSDFMNLAAPTGIVDVATFAAIDRLRALYPFDFKQLRCPCGQCSGFGNGQFRNQYHPGVPQSEATHRYEYPGIHRMLLWSVRAAYHYGRQFEFIINSGYRCSIRNQQTGRTSTNHQGKAIDIDVPGIPGEDRREDMKRCDLIRGFIVEKSNAQIGWAAANKKALEPANIAPTWVHYDVRCYAREYLDDRFFVRTLEELDGVRPALIA